MSTSPILAIEYLEEGQAQAQATANDALNRIDAAIQLTVKNSTTTSPPGSPVNGDAYLIAATAGGAWTGLEGQIAVYYDGWIYLVPLDGWIMWDVAAAKIAVFRSFAWKPIVNGLGAALTGSDVVDVTASHDQTILNANFTAVMNKINNILSTLRAGGLADT